MSQDLQERREEWKEKIKTPLAASGAFFVTVLALLPNLLQATNPSEWKITALLLLSVALPFLAGNAIITLYMLSTKKVIQGEGANWLFMGVKIVGWGLSIIGAWANIMDASFWIGIFFAVAVFMALFVCIKIIADIEAMSK